MEAKLGTIKLGGILTRMRANGKSVAGALLLAAGMIAFMGIITAEAMYPGYSTSDNMISDLGATEPPNSIIEQPSSNIFSGSMMVTGIFVLIATYFVDNEFKKRACSIPIGLFGLGVLGVGIFNGSWGAIHAVFALITFVGGGIAAVLSYKILSPPMKYISVALGAISLGTLLTYYLTGDTGPLAALGMGGIERWVAYPILIWTMGLGGFLMGTSKPSPSTA